jgi:transposase-like protein
MKYQRFTKEFKLEAIRLLGTGSMSGAELARQLGVRRNQLYKWRHQVIQKGEVGAFKGSGRNASKDNLSELEALRRRISQLEEENAILKKAGAYFAENQ